MWGRYPRTLFSTIQRQPAAVVSADGFQSSSVGDELSGRWHWALPCSWLVTETLGTAQCLHGGLLDVVDSAANLSLAGISEALQKEQCVGDRVGGKGSTWASPSPEQARLALEA